MYVLATPPVHLDIISRHDFTSLRWISRVVGGSDIQKMTKKSDMSCDSNE